MSNTHTWIMSQLLKMSPFFPPAETLKLEILKTFLLMRYLVKTIVMWQEMILRVMDISQRLWNILSLLKMLFIIFIYLFFFFGSLLGFMWLTIVMSHQDSSYAHVAESGSEDYLKVRIIYYLFDNKSHSIIYLS